ncbi:MAG: putative metal-binding motif-containing protein [Pseudomonadota bacterium]|nr:putative metal-binding motif-containing protein [Pseudomonadota bacterium]
MLLLSALSLVRAADMEFNCVAVVEPADARPYYDDDDVIGVGAAAYAEVYAWYDASCVATCTSPSALATACEEASCVTAAGATLEWRDETIEGSTSYLSDSARTRTLRVEPPASAGLGWTAAEIEWVDESYMESSYSYGTSDTYRVSWTGTLDAAWPVDGAFTVSDTYADALGSTGHAWNWSSTGCDWAVTWLDGFTDWTAIVAVRGEPEVEVSQYYKGRYDETCDAGEAEPWAYVSDVFWGVVDEETWEVAGGTDADGDGWGSLDCDDTDAGANPCEVEIPLDGIDQNCDGEEDRDGDGHHPTALGGDDCDDTEATIHPDATEVPYDGIDQDCDGVDLTDADGDGRDGVGGGGTDCDDADATAYDGAPETPYDGTDQDCNGTDLTDVDADGQDALAAGGDDCDDADATIYDLAEEVWYDGVDQDCDGTDLTDVDGDGQDAEAAGGDDCDDLDATISPGATDDACDGVDQDCDGADTCPPPLEDDDDDDDAGGCGGGAAGLLPFTLLLLPLRRRVRA